MTNASSTPEKLDLLLKKASQAASSRQLDEAGSLLVQVLELDPDNLRGLDLMGFVLFFQQRYSDAEHYCHRALALAPDHAYAHKGLGLCLARQGRVDEGLISLEQAIALKPEWSDPYWDQAVILSENRRYDEALEVLARGEPRAGSRHRDFRVFAQRIRTLMAEEPPRS